MRTCVILVALLAIAGGASAQTAQRARPAAPQETASPETDAIAVLTREIRALRQEIAETARASLKLQLLTARISAQEQRIIYLDRQRSEATTRRASAEQVRNGIAGQFQTFTGGELAKATPEQRRDMEGMANMFKQQLATHDAAVAQLQTEEIDAASALAQEQGRWADLNQRLEDLERSLK
jgi:hypothetical protein